ncbi:MAG: hypothetical protein KIT84_20175 [Labilithrix sp.]|nr:hypothetical protein [Labilithrix sp.]MCW5813357.1 hypothetical protein [Labilithrix sp.]
MDDYSDDPAIKSMVEGHRKRQRLILGAAGAGALLLGLILFGMSQHAEATRKEEERQDRLRVEAKQKVERDQENARKSAPVLDVPQLIRDVNDNPVQARSVYTGIFYVTGEAQILPTGLLVQTGQGLAFLCRLDTGSLASLHTGEMVGVTGRIQTERGLGEVAPHISDCRLEAHGTTRDVRR